MNIYFLYSQICPSLYDNRVSKKYERTGYNGKHVFHKDTSLSEEELRKRSDRRQELEAAFRKSRALVVSMQEVKGGSSKDQSPESNMTSRGLPTSSIQGMPLSFGFNSNLVALQSMDQRLALMRSQIERSSAALAISGRGGYMPPSAVLGGGLGGGSRSEMLYSMLMANQARPGVSQFGSSGLSSFSPLGGPPPQGLLQDIYQRRQQILMNSASLGAPPMTTPLGTSFAGAAAAEATSPVSTKRTLSGTNTSSPPIADPNDSIEEPDAKRARAA